MKVLGLHQSPITYLGPPPQMKKMDPPLPSQDLSKLNPKKFNIPMYISTLIYFLYLFHNPFWSVFYYKFQFHSKRTGPNVKSWRVNLLYDQSNPSYPALLLTDMTYFWYDLFLYVKYYCWFFFFFCFWWAIAWVFTEYVRAHINNKCFVLTCIIL